MKITFTEIILARAHFRAVCQNILGPYKKSLILDFHVFVLPRAIHETCTEEFQLEVDFFAFNSKLQCSN